jgi:hypothetical protein
MTPGYWHINYWPAGATSYWVTDYWVEYGTGVTTVTTLKFVIPTVPTIQIHSKWR